MEMYSYDNCVVIDFYGEKSIIPRENKVIEGNVYGWHVRIAPKPKCNENNIDTKQSKKHCPHKYVYCNMCSQYDGYICRKGYDMSQKY